MADGSPAIGTGAPLDERTRARVVLPFIVVTLIWSSTWLVIRGQLGDVPETWSVTYRFAISGVAVMLYVWRAGLPLRLTARQHGLAIVYGIAQYGFGYHTVYIAEETVTSGVVAVIFALLLVPNAILARIFLGQRLSRPFLLGSAVAMLGVALLFGHEFTAAPAGRGNVGAGIAWALLAVLLSSIANVLQATDRAKVVPVASLVGWGMMWGTLSNIVVAWGFSGPPPFPANALYWAGTAYLGLLGSALAFTLYFGLVRVMGPARAAYSGVITPVLAMLLSTFFEGYRWTPTAVLGGALAMAGLVVALRAKAR